MTSKSSVIRQDTESFGSMLAIRIGVATLAASKPPGLLRFTFEDDLGSDTVEFLWISSVLYCDELLWNSDNYPYFSHVRGLGGVYECLDSPYSRFGFEQACDQQSVVICCRSKKVLACVLAGRVLKFQTTKKSSLLISALSTLRRISTSPGAKTRCTSAPRFTISICSKAAALTII